MPQAIGLRIYRLSFTTKRDRKELEFSELPFSPMQALHGFMQKYTARTDVQDKERSWYFEPLRTRSSTRTAGLVQYGTYGFSSKLLDAKSNKKKYDRLESDVEQIPLFFDFWQPKGSDFLMVALQSFGPRSCVDLIQGAFKLYIESLSASHVARFRKIMPTDAKASQFGSRAVKRLTFVASRAASDVAQRLVPFKPSQEIDVEVSIKARRSSSFGSFADVAASLEHKPGIWMHEGVGFTQVYAQMNIGGRTRKVGIFGSGSDTGTVDITEEVDTEDGHPTYETLLKISANILADFFKAM